MKRDDPPTNQMAFPGLGAEGEELMNKARRWVATHYDEWQFYCREARLDGDARGYISSDAIVHAMRRKYRNLEVSNDFTAPFARIFLEQLKPVERAKYRPCFRMHESKVDTFTEVRL